MLDPITSFRLFDLPPEVRGMIYGYLVQKACPVKIVSLKVKGQSRRPVRYNFISKAHNRHKGLIWEPTTGKWLNQGPSNFALLQVNKQILQEAAPIVYGDNVFDFETTSGLNVFLNKIGTMRKYLSHVRLPRGAPYTMGCGRTVFNSLLPAMDLRMLAISHIAICSGGGRRAGCVTGQNFVDDCKLYLRKLHKSLWAKDSKLNVLDVVQVVAESCEDCKAGQSSHCKGQGKGCRMRCDDTRVQEHCREVGARLRVLLAEELNIQD